MIFFKIYNKVYIEPLQLGSVNADCRYEISLVEILLTSGLFYKFFVNYGFNKLEIFRIAFAIVSLSFSASLINKSLFKSSFKNNDHNYATSSDVSF